MKRIFIESDILKESEVQSVLRSVDDSGMMLVSHRNAKKFFDKIIGRAMFDFDGTWKHVKEADEIYISSAIIPIDGCYRGSPELFNGFMKLSIKENITGKKVYINRMRDSIHWRNLEKKLVNKCFKKNYLYALNGDHEFEQVDIDKLLKENF